MLEQTLSWYWLACAWTGLSASEVLDLTCFTSRLLATPPCPHTYRERERARARERERNRRHVVGALIIRCALAAVVARRTVNEVAPRVGDQVVAPVERRP